ncbi:MAG: alpha-amylase family glycosyl hydrolase [Flavobacteriaceae bacterium]
MNQAAFHSFLACEDLKDPEKADQQKLFELRLNSNISLIQHLFFELYPQVEHKKDFGKLLRLLPNLFNKRPERLRLLDLSRMAEGNWYQDQRLVGMQLYVDRYNKDLNGLKAKLPYIEDLGVNLIHLMPVTTRPQGQNDGGYAVNSYTKVDPRYGTRADLLRLIKTMHSKQMYVMLDFVVNHTSDEFPWAKKAAAGNKKYQKYYYTYQDRTIPDAFEKSLPEVFPESAPGNFTYNEQMQKWVMTVFNNYQWDLNYRNPEVFMEMLSNLVTLANMGVDIVRFDALAFLWKKLGTISQNLPEAHMVISLFRLCLQVVAPGIVLLAEAIVAPTNIVKYFGQGIFKGNECELAYNATLMALLWNSVATKKTLLLYRNLKNIPSRPQEGAWLNYIRCHDDIGLGFDDRYIYEIGWDASEHRKFLLNYFTQKLEWSPAIGQAFMYNPRTGDGRITGSAASLLGLEMGLKTKNAKLIDQAIDKIVMLHGIILSYGGIPMLYAGDEIGTLNDYSYLNEEDKRDDSRWLNRPVHDWASSAAVHQEGSIPYRVFRQVRHLIALRKEYQVLADHHLPLLHEPNNNHVLAFERTDGNNKGILVLCNFDEHDQALDAGLITSLGYIKNARYSDLITGEKRKLTSGLFSLKPYEIFWLESL